MPNYEFELNTQTGRERSTFTLEDDRPLGPQVDEILAELRARGMVLEGAPEDRPAIYWFSEEMDPSMTPGELGISRLRPIEIVMVSPAEEFEEEAPPAKFFPRGAYSSGLLGFAGGLLAWIVGTLLTDLSVFIDSFHRLDILTATYFGSFVGCLVLGGVALRSDGVPLEGGISGVILGGIGGFLGALIGLPAAVFLTAEFGFAAGRVGAWAILGSAIGLFLGFRFLLFDKLRLLDGALYGGLVGVAAGAVLSIPGPTDFWQGVALCLTGFAIGVGLVLPGTRRCWGLLELEMKDGRSVGLLSVREWILVPGHRRTIAHSVEVECDGEGCRAHSLGTHPAFVKGRPLPADLRNLDRIELGDGRYLFRRVRGGAA